MNLRHLQFIFMRNDLITLFLICAPIVIWLGWLSRKVRRQLNRMYAELSAINAKLGTQFPVNDKERAKYDLNLKDELFFDQEKSIVVRVAKDGSCSVKPWDYVRNWELTWVDHKGTPRQIYMAVGTNDLKEPVVKARFFELPEARNWEQKLNILFS